MIKELKKYTLLCTILFLIFTVTGYALAEFNEEWALKSIQSLMEQLRSLLNDNYFIQFLNIFLHNALTSLIIILTFFSLGVTALLAIFANGLILGVVINVFQKEIGFWAVVASIAPHGIIELPTFLFSIALGARLAVKFAKSFSPKNSFKGYFSQTIKLYFKVVVPLLLLAAFIESYITALLIKNLK